MVSALALWSMDFLIYGINLDVIAEEAPPKDRHYRKYANGIERTLSLFDTALQEWADYISFLNRLLKVGICTTTPNIQCDSDMSCL